MNYRTNNGTLNTFNVDGLNQLTSAPSGACSYDGNGNLIFSSGGLLELTYDDENRLSTVQSNLVVYGTNYGLWKTLYVYDGKGRLRRRVELQVMTIPAEPPPDIDLFGGLESLESEGGGSHPWGTNNITHYIYDDWRVIQERNGSNNVPTVSYTRGTDLSGSLEGAGGIGGLLARSHGYSSGNWSTHNYYHADGNGNVTYLVAANQGQAARYRYDPYGNLVGGSETLGFLGTPNTYRFSSKMVDLKSGHYYYGYRWYEPNFQRWLNRDPKLEEGFVEMSKVSRRGNTIIIDRRWRIASQRNFEDLYVFVFNNPLNRKDPLGLDSPGCDIIPDSIETPCLLECCAEHDACYDANHCSWCSWFNPLPQLTRCGRCNLDWLGCALDCLNGYGDNPDRPNYYCAVHDVSFNDPNSEHMGHSTD